MQTVTANLLTPPQPAPGGRAQVARDRCSVPGFRAILQETVRSLELEVISYNRAQAERSFPDKAATAALTDRLANGVAFVECIARLSLDDTRTCLTAFEDRPPTPEQRAVFDRHPPLAAWQARREARAAEVDRENIAARDRMLAARAAARPPELLSALQARGVVMAVTKEGRITAQPGEALMADELAEIVARKEEFVALLTNEAPPRPLVIA
jgi:hypothetical protein